MKKSTITASLASVLLALVTGCNTGPSGAVGGGLLGAGAGAVIGNQSGHAGEGALIGGAAGAISGAVIGNENRRRNEQYQPQTGHWENRRVTRPNGDSYDERVWVE